jgi:hypothetical protein
VTSIPGLSTASITRVSVTLAKVALVDNTTGAAATDYTLAINVQPVSTTPPDISDAAPMKQFRAMAQIGQDTQALTGTVTSAFKSILAKRPDFANAQFDFVSDDGKLKVAAMPSIACRFHVAIIVGWMPCFAASSASVKSPRIASSATLALNSPVYRFRVVFIAVRPSHPG